MVEPGMTQRMVRKPFSEARRQKDAHIFLSFRTGMGYDTAAAYTKAEVEKRLLKGEFLRYC